VRLDQGQFDALGAKSSRSTENCTIRRTWQVIGPAMGFPFNQTQPQQAAHPVDVGLYRLGLPIKDLAVEPKRKAVGYYRISGQRQGMLRAELEGQRQSLKAQLSENGLQLLVEFVDYENGSRAAFVQLGKAIDLCRQRGAVLVLPKVGLLIRDWAFLGKLHAGNIDILALDASGLTRASAGELAVVARRSDRRLPPEKRFAPAPMARSAPAPGPIPRPPR
jgi:hypothetical protein